MRRAEEEHEITLARGLVQGVDLPYHWLETGLREYFKDWPDLHTRLVHLVEGEDLVAYHAENQRYNARFGRSAVRSESAFVRVQDGKITD